MNYSIACSAISLSAMLLGCSSYPILNKTGTESYEVIYEYSDVYSRFGRNRDKAISEYLEFKKMIPAECVNGIIVLRAQDYEGGKALAEFRCKE